MTPSDAQAEDTQASAHGQDPATAEALRLLQQQMGALGAYFGHFVQAQLDYVKMTGRQVALGLLLGGLGAVVLLTLIVVAVVLLLTGVTTGVSLALGGSLWLGQVSVGGGLLLLVAGGTWWGCRRVQARARREKEHAYAERQLRQRTRYGYSVADHAHGPPV